MMSWRNAERFKPKHNGEVLVWDSEWNGRLVAEFDGGEFRRTSDSAIMENVSHWKPLPAPPCAVRKRKKKEVKQFIGYVDGVKQYK